MAGDSEFTPIVRRLSCLRGVGTLTAFGWRSRSATGTGSPATRSPHSSDWFPRNTPRAPRGRRDRSPRPATLTPAACSSRQPGITGQVPARERCTPGGTCTGSGRDARPRRQPASAPTMDKLACAGKRPRSPTSRSPASSPAGAGPWQSWTTDRHGLLPARSRWWQREERPATQL